MHGKEVTARVWGTSFAKNQHAVLDKVLSHKKEKKKSPYDQLLGACATRVVDYSSWDSLRSSKILKTYASM